MWPKTCNVLRLLHPTVLFKQMYLRFLFLRMLSMQSRNDIYTDFQGFTAMRREAQQPSPEA